MVVLGSRALVSCQAPFQTCMHLPMPHVFGHASACEGLLHSVAVGAEQQLGDLLHVLA